MSQKAEIQRQQRRVFARPGSSFDVLVRILRIVLPVGVGVLLAIMALSPVTERNEFSFLLNKNDVDRASDAMNLTEALYRGEDKAGKPFVLRARSAVQRDSAVSIVEMQGLVADFSIDGNAATISAQRAAYNMEKDSINVLGPMQYSNENGDAFTVQNVRINMNDKSLFAGRGDGGVRGQGSFGTFSAAEIYGSMEGRKIRLTGEVSGSSDFGTYRANMLNASLQDKKVMLSGDVSGATDFGTYRADRLRYNAATGDIVLEGNARLRLRP